MDNLDQLCELKAVRRQVYGVLHSKKPNDHCYWNADFAVWEEDDEHFMARVLEQAGKGSDNG